jgi:hypothetical protein
LTDPDPKKRPAMPVAAGDFGKDVEEFVKEYLRPVLSENEKKRLDKAEGQWPLYPMTLVEIADRHPLALPQKRGPSTFAELPNAVRRDVEKRYGKKKDGAPKVKEEQFFHNLATNPKFPVAKRLEKLDATATVPVKFACAVATWLHSAGVKQLPFELWATEDGLAPPMKAFVDTDGPFYSSLTQAEREHLRQTRDHWPEYPLKIRELADKYGFKPPWHSLPEPADLRHSWDKYRVP